MLDISPNQASPLVRVCRAELFAEGSAYWAACRADDADAEMFGPMMMPHAVPGDMLNNQKAEAVWSIWYGSLKEARKAASLSGRRLTTLEGLSSPKLEELSPFARLTRRLDHDLVGLAADKAHTGASTVSFRHHTRDHMPLLQLDTVIAAQIGAENFQQIYRLAMAAPAADLASIVEGEFPFMAALHERGAMLRSTSRNLLAIACLEQRLQTAAQLRYAEVLATRLLITVLVRTLPSRLGTLVAVSNPLIDGCFDWPCCFAGVTSADLKQDQDIWEMVSPIVLDQTVRALQDYTMPTYADAPTDALIRKLDEVVMAARSGKAVGLELNAVYQQFLSKIALPMYDELKLFIDEGGIFFAVQPYALSADMIRPGFSLAFEGKAISVATCLFSVILSTHFAGPATPLLRRFARHKAELNKTGDKIESLSGSSSPAKVAKIEAIGKRGMAALEEGRMWFVTESSRLKPLITAWAEFYSQVDSLRRQCLN